MPEFDGSGKFFKGTEQSFEPLHRFRCVPEAGRKLKQQATDLGCFGERQYPCLELLEFGGRPCAFAMGELLPYLDRKLEIIRRPAGPALRGFGTARTIKRGIDFDGIKVARVKLQLVRSGEGIKQSSPGA